MPSVPRIVQVSQGLRTSTDPSMLGEGEVVRADDGEYKPGDDRIHKVKSRSAFNSSAEGASVVGGIFAQFDGYDDRLIIATSTTYKEALAAKSGAFSSLVTGLTAPTSLEAIQYNNEYHLLDGVNRIRAVDGALDARLTGMLANTQPPTIDPTGGVGTGFTIAKGSRRYYWVEERRKEGDRVVVRNGCTAVETIDLLGDGSTTFKPLISRPAQLNSDATHWALFASATVGKDSDNPFPTGAEIAEVLMSVASIEDTNETNDPGVPDGDAYQIVTVTLGGAATSVAKWGEPPLRCDTGDIFEDAMVVNDLDNPRLIRWSFFDEMNAWPSIARARVGDTKFSDRVKLIRRLGSFVLIACEDSLWRMNTLPISEDAAFQPQRVREKGLDAHGCVGAKAGDIIDFGRGVRLAYVSRYGLMVTDGFAWDDISDDLAWAETFEAGSLGSAVLVYNPAKYRLQMYATPKGGTANSVGYYFHLHPYHAKVSARGGVRAKVTGPVTVPNVTGAFIATISGERRVFVCSSDGKVYLEDEQNSDASGNGITFVVQTAEVYLGGAGNEALSKRIGVHHSAGEVDTQEATITLISRLAGTDDVEAARVMSLKRRELTDTHQRGKQDSCMVQVRNSDALGSFSVDYMVIGAEPQPED